MPRDIRDGRTGQSEHPARARVSFRGAHEVFFDYCCLYRDGGGARLCCSERFYREEQALRSLRSDQPAPWLERICG